MGNTNKLTYCIVGDTAEIAVTAMQMLQDSTSGQDTAIAGSGAVHRGRRRKSPSKKLQNQMDNEASLVFADPTNHAVIRVWASRILARSLPAAMNLNKEQCQRISEFAQDIAKLVDADEDSSANMLLRAGEYIVRNNEQKIGQLKRTLHMRRIKQRLTLPNPNNGFSSNAPTQNADDDEVESPISRTSIRGF
jgi:hypothetical protein